MRKTIIFAAILLVLAVNLITITSAGTVNLEISTYANHNVTVIVLDPNKEDPITTLTGSSDSSAKASFNFTTTSGKVDFSVTIRKNGKIIVFKKFEGYTPIGQISLIVLKSEDSEESQNETNISLTGHTAEGNSTNITAESNTTENENTELTPTVDSSPENQTTINETGEANISEDYLDIPIFKIIAYTLLILCLIFVIVGIILFLIFKKKMKSPKDIKVRKYSEIKDEINGSKEKAKTGDGKRLVELEGKIKEMQDEIDEIRNKKHKIKEAEEKIKQDMKELERLKKNSE